MIAEKQEINDGFRISLELYRDSKIFPGHFLSGLLENNVFAALERADELARSQISTILIWIVANLPPQSYGSPRLVGVWLRS